MLFTTSFKFVALLALFSGPVLAATQCQKGEFVGADHECHDCPAGTHYDGANHPASGPPTTCDPCPPGTYNNTPGKENCQKCEPGTFNSVPGAKSCCKCCAGFYGDDGAGQTSCFKCPAAEPFSEPGAHPQNECSSGPTGSLPVATCDMTGNACPPTTLGGPVGSPITKKKRDVACARGFKACPHWSGRGGFDCVDVANDPEMCGGCVGSPDDVGVDCTAAEGVSVTECTKRKCVIRSCRRGYTMSKDGKSCRSTSRITGQEVPIGIKRRGL